MLIFAAAALLVAASLRFVARLPGQEVRRYPSPNGRYAVVLRAEQFSIRPMAPGSGSDRSGYVELVGPDGDRVEREHIDMLLNVNAIEWRGNTVEVFPLFSWKLSGPAEAETVPQRPMAPLE